MTREEIREDILNLNSNCILAELPTSVGKSKVALDFMNEKKITTDILVVIPRLVLIENWKKEFAKWGYEPYLNQVTFTTYISLPKFVGKKFGLIIFDECHHLSERAREAVEDISSDYYLLLSATVTKEHKKDIKMLFPNVVSYKISMRKAIDENILPDPKVYLVPLELDNKSTTETLIINPKAKGKEYEISFAERFKAKACKSNRFKIKCTQEQYYKELSDMTEYYKRQYFRTNNQSLYFRWQQKARERLIWLSSLKDNIILQILDTLKDKRTLTFCNGIEQTQTLGKYCINSKNSESYKYLQDFNDGKINHITACNILNEGCNLTNCQVGIFVSINSSDIMIKQKNGRILRHPEPIIIIAYYKNTREEELVNDIVENYNPKLITVVNKLEQLYEINN